MTALNPFQIGISVRKQVVWLCVCCLLLSGCRNYEITDLGSSLIGEEKPENTLPLTVGIVHEKDQSSLNNAESSVEVTFCFANVLAQSRLFDKVIYPFFPKKDLSDLILRVDFERNFDLHRGFNVSQNLLLLASCFLLSAFLKLKVDYEIRGTVRVLHDGREFRIYHSEAGCRARMNFFAPVEKTADTLSDQTMRRISRELTQAFLKDQALYLGLAVKDAGSGER